MRVPVRLIADAADPALGQMENASISGAFVQTSRLVLLGSRLEIELPLPGEPGSGVERIAAYVTRRTRTGVGVEWCELAPAPVRALLAASQPRAARSPRAEPLRGLRPGALCINE